MTFHAQLRAHHDRLGLSLPALASLCGVSYGTLQSWLYSQRTPKLPTQEGVLARLAKAQPKRK